MSRLRPLLQSRRLFSQVPISTFSCFRISFGSQPSRRGTVSIQFNHDGIVNRDLVLLTIKSFIIFIFHFSTFNIQYSIRLCPKNECPHSQANPSPLGFQDPYRELRSSVPGRHSDLRWSFCRRAPNLDFFKSMTISFHVLQLSCSDS